MRKAYTLRGLVSLFMLTLCSIIGGVNAQTTEVFTFNAKEFTTNEGGEICWKTNGIAESTNKGYNDTYKGVQIGAKGSTVGVFSLLSIEGKTWQNVTKVEVVCRAGKNAKASITDVQVGDVNFSYKDEDALISEGTSVSDADATYSFTSETPSSGGITISFNATGSVAMYICAVKVTYNEGGSETGKKPAGLAYATTSYEMNEGEAFTAPELTNPNNLTVSYASSNDNVAAVNAATGAVTVKGIGSATITASFAGDDTYEAGEASYTLTVKKVYVMHDGVAYYKKVEDASDIVDGAQYIFVVEGTKEGVVAMSNVEEEKGKYFNYAKISLYGDGCYLGAVNTPGAPYEVTLHKGDAEGDWKLTTIEGSIKHVSGTTIGVGQDTNEKAFLWRVYDENCAGKVTSVLTTDRFLAFNNTTPRISTYTGSSYPSVVLYRKVSTIEVTADEGYATFYTDHAFVMPEGMQGAVATGAEGDQLTLDYRYTAGSVVPANTALLVKAPKGKYVYNVAESAEQAPADNKLRGTIEEDLTTGEAGDKFYKLARKNGANLGFYYGAANGAAFTNGAYKAYLALPENMSAANGFILGGEATGIDTIESGEANGAVYTLSGVRVKADRLPAGLYVKNGKKFIVK